MTEAQDTAWRELWNAQAELFTLTQAELYEADSPEVLEAVQKIQNCSVEYYRVFGMGGE